MEEWRDVKGFEGIYQISNHGRLKSFKKDKNGYILSLKNKTGWYINVVLKYRNKRKSIKLHQLVAEAFIPNPENKPQINHKDGNKQNNHVSNLEWVTRKENVKHAINMNPNMIKGMKKYNKYIRPKTVQQYNLEGELMAEYPNCKLASQITGVCARNIHQVASKSEYKPGMIRKQAGGYIWKFKDERVNDNAS